MSDVCSSSTTKQHAHRPLSSSAPRATPAATRRRSYTITVEHLSVRRSELPSPSTSLSYKIDSVGLFDALAVACRRSRIYWRLGPSTEHSDCLNLSLSIISYVSVERGRLSIESQLFAAFRALCRYSWPCRLESFSKSRQSAAATLIWRSISHDRAEALVGQIFSATISSCIGLKPPRGATTALFHSIAARVLPRDQKHTAA